MVCQQNEEEGEEKCHWPFKKTDMQTEEITTITPLFFAWISESDRRKQEKNVLLEKLIFNLLQIRLQASGLKSMLGDYDTESREVADLDPFQALQPILQPMHEYNPLLKL